MICEPRDIPLVYRSLFMVNVCEVNSLSPLTLPCLLLRQGKLRFSDGRESPDIALPPLIPSVFIEDEKISREKRKDTLL
ncbi:MAG: hypothetical protein UV38_C0002G0201 [candidate division TM6 bacterium GW2011_GWE2_42_60]|nr:MAG: hypothetical protein UV38_C0002G0201 [candidate division TM6 bacterium GW2011_GWE2_42_60]